MGFFGIDWINSGKRSSQTQYLYFTPTTTMSMTTVNNILDFLRQFFLTQFWGIFPICCRMFRPFQSVPDIMAHYLPLKLKISSTSPSGIHIIIIFVSPWEKCWKSQKKLCCMTPFLRNHKLAVPRLYLSLAYNTRGENNQKFEYEVQWASTENNAWWTVSIFNPCNM